ncbi:Bub1/Mad3 [Kluyveromyces lactis]|nr:Bub1/Mad3 [Kluyveromyces lactis]
MGPIHFDELEAQKENIISLPQGRSATRVASAINKSLSSIYDTRLAFERDIHDTLDELDDPLQLFLEYINWIHDNYPSPTTRQSGLPEIMERCIEYCKNIETYKNDVRYLKVWLQYIDLFAVKLDEKREMFVYMMRLEIGDRLALYYESFSQLLINMDASGDALDLIERGIEKKARPLRRLERFKLSVQQAIQTRGLTEQELPRSFSTFEIHGDLVLGRYRSEINDTRNNSISRNNDSSSSERSQNSLRSTGKLQVFADNEEELQNDKFMLRQDLPALPPYKTRNKENHTPAVPFKSGSTIAPLKQSNSFSQTDLDKIPVFRDDLGRATPVYKLIEVPGRKPEKIQTNFNLLYPTADEEYCIEEVLALARNCYYKKKNPSVKRHLEENNHENSKPMKKRGLQPKSPEYQKVTTTSILPLKGDIEPDGLTGHSDGKSKSPTVTMFSKDAMNEVYSMFNQSYHDMKNYSDHDDTTSGKFTMYENFQEDLTGKNSEDLTEVKQPMESRNLSVSTSANATPSRDQKQETTTPTYKSKLQDYMTPIQERTEPNFKTLLSQDDDITGESRRKSANSVNTAESSPFLTQPQRLLDPSPSHQIVENPLSLELRRELLESLNPALASYPTYYEYSQQLKMSSLLKRIQKVSKNMNKNPIVDFKKTNDLYCIRRELGEGGYATVYLAESSTGQLSALKVEKPASVWEFYILKQIERRVPDEAILKSIINVSALHCFQDESYLVLNYANQGTILDLVNWERERNGGALDECLCMFITVELMRVLECIHDVGIIHGDIKPDNCMIRFQKVPHLGKYSTNGENGWNRKGIYLIDFGRSFDLSLFPLGTKFRSNWKTDQQDCPEMREQRPWSYEADYYGLAGVIFCMLFGHYIETVKIAPNRYQLKSPLKRYWQQDMWDPLFDLLINSGAHDNTLVSKLRHYRERMESYLERESALKLRNVVLSLEADLEHFRK